MDFSQWLQAEMKRLDLTNYRLAKISSVHQTTISNILNGKKPQIETERKIRDAISEIRSNLPEKKENPASVEAGFHPTLEDWLNAIDCMSREEMRAVMSRVMERYAGEDK